MKTRAMWISVLGLLSGCADGVVVGAQHQAILDGTRETGYPAVGNFLSKAAPKNECTAALVSHEFVLSAGHCGINWFEDGAEKAYTFALGNDASDATVYALDALYRHPKLTRVADVFSGPYDMMLFHLVVPQGDSPEETAARDRLMNTQVLETTTDDHSNEDCTAVGFGEATRDDHDEEDVFKRSAKVKVESVDGNLLLARQITGIPGPGDSGGPLICKDGKIIAVDHATPDSEINAGIRDDGHMLEEYNRMDGWVSAFLAAWEKGDRPLPNPIKW